MNETMMTSEAATPTEGEATFPETNAPATAAAGEGQQQTEGNATETTAVEGDKPAEQKQPEGAPEAYEFKAPEGREYDPASLKAFADAARELNMPQDAAQKMLDKLAPAYAEVQQAKVQAVQTEWATASKADKEFGGDKLNENLATARKAMDQFATPELRSLLNETGLGNHPEVIRLFVRAGKAISEDGFVPAGKQAQGTDPAKRLFPNQP